MIVMQRDKALWPCPIGPAKGSMICLERQFINCAMAVLGCEMSCVSVCLLFMCNCTTVNVA